MISRRKFLQQSLLAGASLSGLGSTSLGLNQLLAATHPYAKVSADYKALVCIFLYGGNDGFNMVVPNDSVAYGNYLNSRQNLAIPQEQLLPITPSSGGDYGFHPAMPELQQLFSQGRLAIQANVGPLIEPVTRAQVQNQTAQLPPQLFSHNNQQALWESGYSSELIQQGWGGRVADYSQHLNSAMVPMSLSISGNNRFQVGSTTTPYAMNSSGVDVMYGVRSSISWEQERAAVFHRIRDLSTNHILETAHKELTRDTQDIAEILQTALETAPDLGVSFPNDNYLASQLAMVARLIGISEELGFQRQIFFVGMGGFDTHDRQNADQPMLFSQISQAMSFFNQATESLGVSDQVTAFTHSDFGRTLTSNGDGTDHGWGSHHLVMGGAVRGGDIFGTMPELSIGGPDDFDDGRMIPTTSVEQYSATLAQWFGVESSDLNQIFPNLVNFNQSNMGFMV